MITPSKPRGNHFLSHRAPCLIIDRVIRRLHAPQISVGIIELDQLESHHARDVLRLRAGDEIQLFDDTGKVADGRIVRCDKSKMLVEIGAVTPAPTQPLLVVASAVPKGERADWMIEKLSELGVSRFVPLATERSIV